MSRTANSIAENAIPEPARLVAEGITLSRGEVRLMEGVGFTLEPGGALLLTGPNGTGKTTLMRAIAGFVRPDTGSLSLNGEAAALLAPDLIGWLGHADGLKPGETLRQALRFWAGLHGQDRKAIMPVMRTLAIDHLIDRTASSLSRGQQRRAGLARVALTGRPLWLLDEPAGPLDGAGRDRLAELVAAHRARGGSVIAATHQVLDWPDAQILDLGAHVNGAPA